MTNQPLTTGNRQRTTPVGLARHCQKMVQFRLV